MSQVVTNSEGVEVILKLDPKEEKPEETKDLRARRWCATLNNYTKKELSQLSQYFEKKNYSYIIGEEIGEEGTPHLQIYFESKGAVRFTTLKKYNDRIHWEVAKGNRESNYIYCKKEGKYIQRGIAPLADVLISECLEEYKDIVWKPWQKEIIDRIEGKADNRRIFWYWEPIGNVGKSFLCKYIVCKYGAIIADGKKDNVFNQVLKGIVEGRRPRIVILDVPRCNLEFINYGCIEQLKNGLIYSGKYEGGQCCFPSPHIFIFANAEPDITKMSIDRWCITSLVVTE